VLGKQKRRLGKGDKNVAMILDLKMMCLLQIHLNGNYVPVVIPAKNPPGAAHKLRSEGKLLISCKTDLFLLCLVPKQQSKESLMLSVLALHLACKWNSHLSRDHIQGVQDLQDPNLYMDSKLKWPETITSKMSLSEKPVRKMYTNMRNVRGLKGVFGANYMQTSIPLL
jgi:hypothetical protein